MEAYALVTAAHNEEKYIEYTLKAVTSQTTLPRKWIIISDGSTDRTDELVQKYSESFPFIQLVRFERDNNRNFGSATSAQNAAIRMLPIEEFDFAGVVDADVSFSPTYYQDLLEKFRRDPELGLAGGYICEERNGRFAPVSGNRTRSVAGAVMMFRRQCYQDMGPLIPIRYGGQDACAEIMCRMKGWRARSFPELEVRHHRPNGRASGLLRYRYMQGFMDYAIGYHPLFEIAVLARRIPYPPFLLGTMVRSAGYIAANFSHERRMVSPEFVAFLRNEQIERLRQFVYGHLE